MTRCIRASFLVLSERIKFTAAEIPKWLDSETAGLVDMSIRQSFHTTFSFVMKLCAGICLIGSVLTYILIDDSKIQLD